MVDDLSDRTAVVTGGNTGIGKATAFGLTAAGANVLITGRNEDRLETVAEQDPDIEHIGADMTNYEYLPRIVERAHDYWGPIDILINNAAANGFTPVGDQSPEFVENMYATNVIGPTLLIEEAASDLKERGGVIINISSIGGHKVIPGGSTYGGSKAALEQLTRYWAFELAPDVRVNALAPGAVDTQSLKRMGIPKQQREQMRAQFREDTPLNRLGEPNDIADWVVRLAEPQSSWITGQVVSIDGGASIV